MKAPHTTPTTRAHAPATHAAHPAAAAVPVPQDSQQRRIRWFVGLHLAAVGTVYVVAFSIGGGWDVPMPPIGEGRNATVPSISAAPEGERTANATVGAPDWTQRAEVAPPWEQR